VLRGQVLRGSGSVDTKKQGAYFRDWHKAPVTQICGSVNQAVCSPVPP
jgi:hypothetical protein